MTDLELAISTGSFHPAKTDEALARIASLGFSQAEITIQSSDLGYDFHRRFDSEHFEEMGRKVRDLGVRVGSLHGPRLSGVDAFSSRARGEILLRTLEIASNLESDEIVVHPYHVFQSYEKAYSFLSEPTSRLMDSVLPGFLSLLQRAKEGGIRVGIENIAHWHDDSLLNEPGNMLRLVSSLNSKTVAVDLDVYHSEFGGNTPEFFDRVGDHIMSLHLCDYTYSRERALPGRGRIDWKELAMHAEKLPGLKHIVLEVSGGFEDQELAQSAGYLREVFR